MLAPRMISKKQQEESLMPKQKTHRGSAKRFKRTGGGGLKRSQPHKPPFPWQN